MMKKVIIGLIVGILGGLVVWWLTQPGGSLNPEKPEPGPIIRILEFEVPPAPLGGVTNARFRVFNDSSMPAENCRIHWWSHGLPYAPSVSPQFGLAPQETREFTIQSLRYTSPGNVTSMARVDCAGCGSEALKKEVHIYQNP